MKNRRLLKSLAAGVGLAVAPAAHAQFDTLHTWGDAVGDGGAAFTDDGTNITITGGGADFWGGSDQGVAISNSAGDYTTTGDFSASIQFNNVNADIARDWGRSGLSARATTGGAPAANDAHTMAVMRSNGLAVTGWRDVAGEGTGRSGNGFATGSVAPGVSPGVRMSVGRSGDQIITAFSTDLGASGTYSPWIVDQNRAPAALAGGTEVTVTAFHQAHNQDPNTADSPIINGGGGTRVNTGSMQDFAYTESFDPTQYFTVGNALNVSASSASGQVIGTSNLVDLNGTASTTENTNWQVVVSPVSTFQVNAGPGGKNGTEMNAGDLVPAANFRYDTGGGTAPGLVADIYVGQGNAGNIADNQTYIDANAASGTAIIPQINWTGGSDDDANYNGLTGPASFGVAVQGVDPADGTAGSFSGNEENYGVDMSGQIFIEANGGHMSEYEMLRGGEWVEFKDGIDDFTFLEIDGQVVLNDNNWTGVESTQNGGGDFGVFDASDPKFDDGEWVDFRMVMWEGGGGDAGQLYSDMYDDDGSFDGIEASGSYQGGAMLSGTGNFDDEAIVDIPGNGQFFVTLTTDVDGRSVQTSSGLVEVIPEPSTAVLFGLAAAGLLFRRRR